MSSLRYGAPVMRLWLFVAPCLLFGCTSLRSVPIVITASQLDSPTLKQGDHVALVMRDGTKARFTIDSIDADVLVSTDGRRYARADITELKQRKFSPGKTITLAVGISAVVFVIALAAATASLFDDAFSQ